MRTVAVVLAGGIGQRFGGGRPKQLHRLAGRTVLEHSIAAFDAAPGVDEVMLVLPPGLATAPDVVDPAAYPKLTQVIEGGVARADSTRCAIAAIAAGLGPGETPADRNVLLHDAARPLVDQQIIADCVAALGQATAIGVAVPSSDTIVVVDGDVMTVMPSRPTLRRCQTPQGFRLSVIMRAHELALADPTVADAALATDDCGVVLKYLPDVPIVVVPGSERNIKVTYPTDLEVAEILLRGVASSAS